MPVCVHCNYPAKTVYTVYQSIRNTRLGVCEKCSRFTDPLIEHPSVLLLLDLILLKPRVYRHLIFNRASEPTRAATGKGDEGITRDRSQFIWGSIVKLGIAVTFVESLVLVKQISGDHNIDWTNRNAQLEQLVILCKALFGNAIGNTVQHLATTLISWGFLHWLGWFRAGKKVSSKGSLEKDGRKLDFTLSMVPLTLLYASLLPLCLHVVLLIWSPSDTLADTSNDPFIYIPNGWLSWIPDDLRIGIDTISIALRNEKIDEMWIATHLLSGMSSGLALRILLPTRPVQTMIAVLGGWLARAGVGHILLPVK